MKKIKVVITSSVSVEALVKRAMSIIYCEENLELVLLMGDKGSSFNDFHKWMKTSVSCESGSLYYSIITYSYYESYE